MVEGWQIKEELDLVLDAVVDAGDCGMEPTTVVDWTSGLNPRSCAAAQATRPALSEPLSDLGGAAGPVGRPELALEKLARSGARQFVQ